MSIRTDIPTPRRIAKLPLSERGYPVPWFVDWIDGKPDFRIIAHGKIRDAVRFDKCWICGETLGKYKAFVIGPMCSINRISSEPPSHKDCAIYAARVCPFLTNPKEKRNEKGLEDLGAKDMPGVAIKHNPGVAIVWVTTRYAVMRVDDGVLFGVGDPLEVLWYHKGESATRDQATESINKGYPLLMKSAEEEGTKALEQLEKQRKIAERYLPRDIVKVHDANISA